MPILKIGLCQGLTESVVNSLKLIGIKSYEDFIYNELKVISCKSGISQGDLKLIRRSLLAQFSAYLIDGQTLYNRMITSVAILDTGCLSINNLLNGGFWTGEITEVIGKSAAGKTQLCLNACISIAAKSKNVIYIDSNTNFSANRLNYILAARNTKESDATNILTRIKRCIALNIFETFEILEDIKYQLLHDVEDYYKDLKLLIIDSLPALLNPILNKHHVDSQGLISRLSYVLKSLSFEHAIAVVTINHVTTSEDGQYKACLGRAWQFVPNVRIMLSQKNDNREAVLIKSSRKSLLSSATFVINHKGLECSENAL